MYPTPAFPNDGIFIKEQIEYCQKKYAYDFEVVLIDRTNNKYFNYARSMFNINNLIAKKKFDLVHIHFGISGLFLLANPYIKIPSVVTLHGTDILTNKKGGLLKLVSKKVVNRANYTIIMNDKMADILKGHTSKLIKIPCGIDLETFSLDRDNLKNEKFRIGFPSNKERKVKNYALFKKITDALIEKGYPIEIIEFRDFTRNQVSENLSQLDCLIMTSHSEGSPQIIKEAIALGTPIVSSNVGDVSILLEGINNCSVINSFNADDFTEKVIQIIDLPPIERVANGKDKIKSLRLDQDSVSDNIYNLYKKLTI